LTANNTTNDTTMLSHVVSVVPEIPVTPRRTTTMIAFAVPVIPVVPVTPNTVVPVTAASKKEEEEQNLVLQTGMSSVLSTKSDVQKKTSFRFSVSEDVREKTHQSLLSELSNHRNERRLEKFKKRRELPMQTTPINDQQTTTSTEQQQQQQTTAITVAAASFLKNKGKHRPGLKSNTLPETNKAALQEEGKVARALKSETLRQSRRLQGAAAAKDRKEAQHLQAKVIRQEATRILAEADKVVGPKIASNDENATSISPS
jgi:hypothetical protein